MRGRGARDGEDVLGGEPGHHAAVLRERLHRPRGHRHAAHTGHHL